MKLDVYNLANKKTGVVEVADSVFATEVKPHLFHEVVRMQLANRRAGTHKGKTRREVRGGGKKPFRQKGTGHARQGSSRAVQWVGGGVAFAKRPRDYSYYVNKKVRRAALRCALSMLVAEGRLKVVDAFELEAIKTKVAMQTLQRLDVAKAVIVDGVPCEEAGKFLDNEKLDLSIRNLPTYKYLRPEGVNVYDLLRFGAAVMTTNAVKALEARLAP